MDHKLHKPHLSTAQDARAVRTREALRHALLRLLGTKPLDQITIRDISASARVGYTTFFRHHTTKDSLLNDVAAEQIKRLIDLVLPVLDAGDTRAVSVALCTYVDQHRALWSTLLTGGAAGALREEFMRISRQIAATRSQPDHWLPNEVAVILVISATIELLAWWLRQKYPLTIEQIAKIHDRIVVSPTLNSDESGAWRRARPDRKLLVPKRSARKKK
jgi:AcrR family transcriptional regulator